MSKPKKKKSDNKVNRLTSYINLVIAILNLIATILLVKMNS